MRTNPTSPSSPSHESNLSSRKYLAWGLLVVGLMGGGALQRDKIFGIEAERPAAATAPKVVRPPQAAASRPKAAPLSPAEAERQRWERLRAMFLNAQSIEDTMEQSEALDRCMKDITPEVAALLLVEFKPEDLKGSGAQRLFDHWASANPSEAATWAQSQGDAETRKSFLSVAAMRWTVVDLKAAATWARSLPEGSGRAEIMAAVGSEAVRSDPLEALLMGFELPASAAQANLILRAAAEWAATDRDNAVEWAKRIEDKGLRQQVTAQIVVASAEADPLSAATMALQQMTPGEEQDRAVVSIVQRWVQTDPELASTWVRGFPDGALGRDAVDNLITLWAARDSVASGKWLLTLPAGELRDTGLLAYSRALARTDEAFAQRWLLSPPKVQ